MGKEILYIIDLDGYRNTGYHVCGVCGTGG